MSARVITLDFFVAVLRDARRWRAPQDEGLLFGKVLDPHGEEPAKRASRTMRPSLFTTLHAMVLS